MQTTIRKRMALRRSERHYLGLFASTGLVFTGTQCSQSDCRAKKSAGSTVNRAQNRRVVAGEFLFVLERVAPGSFLFRIFWPSPDAVVTTRSGDE